jgi:hypothetical protein
MRIDRDAPVFQAAQSITLLGGERTDAFQLANQKLDRTPRERPGEGHAGA